MNSGGKREKALFVQLGGLGDLLLSVPAMKALKREHGAVTGLFASPAVERLALATGLVDASALRSSTLRTIMTLRRMGPWTATAIAQGHNPKKGALLFRMIGCKNSSGENGNYTHRVNVTYGEHAAKRTADVVRALGIEVDETDYKITLPSEAAEKAGAFLKERNLGGKRLIAVHPGSHPNLAYKRWPVERFAETLHRLQEEMKIHLLIVGGSDEKDLAEDLIRQIGNGINTAGCFSVEETAALLKRCDVLLTNDSGVMHLSAAVGTPVCAVYAMTDPAWIGPLGEKNRIVRTTALDCSPCYNRGRIACEERPCLFAVTPERVHQNLREILDAKETTR